MIRIVSEKTNMPSEKLAKELLIRALEEFYESHTGIQDAFGGTIISMLLADARKA